MRTTFFGVLGALSLALGASASAVPVAKKALFQSTLAGAQRLYVYLPLVHRDRAGLPGERTWGSLQVDIAARKLAFDGPGFRYRYVGGQSTFHHATMMRSTPAMSLPFANSTISAMLTQLDNGFSNATWTREDPPPVANGLAPVPQHEWWRIAFPGGTWDDGYRIYLQLTGMAGCEVWQVAVLRADVDRIAQFVNPVDGSAAMDLRFPLCTGVTWNPTFSMSRYGAPADPFAHTLFLQRSMHRDEFRAQ